MDSSSIANSWIQVSASQNQTCALHSTQYVYCWGSNSNGQSNPSAPGVNVVSPHRIIIPGSVPATYPDLKISATRRYYDRERRLSVSGTHSCAITSHLAADNPDTNDNGKLYCWGMNVSGESGNTVSTSDVLTPLRVSTTSVFNVAAGHSKSCAITAVSSLTARTLRCFGSGDYGALGTGTTSNVNFLMIDRDVQATTIPNVTYNFVALGYDHSCAVSTGSQQDSSSTIFARFAVRCGGFNRVGQLGLGDSTNVATPKIVDNYSSATGGHRNYSYVTGGYRNVCGIEGSTNALYCWGASSSKLVGDGVTSSSGTPFAFSRTSPVLIDKGESYTKIGIGYTQACAVTTLGFLKCWGENSDGRLGVGFEDLTTPVTVNPTSSYSQVSSGNDTTCAITTTGVLHCWGINASGQAGNGTTTSVLTPAIVDNSVSYSKISVGFDHTCGITTASKLKCWGRNANGQLGDGTINDSSIPVAIDSANDYLEVSAGERVTCALRKSTIAEGYVVCWGDNSDAQIGNNTTGGSILTPTQIADSGGTPISDLFIQVGASDNHSCALRTDGKVLCWGRGSAGQLGTGSIESLIPYPVISAINQAQRLTVFGSGTCAIESTDNALKCWGYDEFGTTGLHLKSFIFQYVPSL